MSTQIMYETAEHNAVTYMWHDLSW
jgi:hypothetical protein